ncbi:MAG: pirin family protein [Vulcanimicrobiaceae bacterium]
MPGTRSIDLVLPAPRAHWASDGFLVRRYLWRDRTLALHAGPFLLIDHHPPFVYPPTSYRRGLPLHPHRGIDTVTLAFDGAFEHRDTDGVGGVLQPGDVEWTTAGRGIVHRECHEAAFARAGGTLQLVQLWINLPAAHKMTAPRYRRLAADAVETVALADGAGTVRVIAGTYADRHGPTEPFSPVDIFDVRLRDGARFQFDVAATHDAMVLVMHGRSSSDERLLEAGSLAFFERRVAPIALAACAADTHLLVLCGMPLDEPLAMDGPFVMNTADDIRRAYADFKAHRIETHRTESKTPTTNR